MDNLQQERPNVNFHKYYESVFTVVRKEIFRVFLWLYEGGNQYVGDYLGTTPRGMKRLGAMEKRAIQRREKPAKFDISFLYHLLQHTCGLAEDSSHIWTKPQTPEERKTVEHMLYLLKMKRNLLGHQPQTIMKISRNKLEQKLDKIRQLCTLMLQKAGHKAHKSALQINTCINNMEKALDNIKTQESPSGYTKQLFAVLASEEIRKSNQNPSESTNRFVMPLLQNNGENRRYEMPLKNFALWRCDDGSLPSTMILSGDVGTGKSTLCRFLHDSWVHSKVDINNLNEFDLVIPVVCNKISTRNILDFLEELLPNTISLCGRKDTLEFFKSLKVLWLVDGFEEATVDVKELIKFIQQYGASHLMLITTSPNLRQSVIDVLVSMDKVCEVTLAGLCNESMKLFIQSVFNERVNDLTICEQQITKFLQDIQVLGRNIMQELCNPLKLSLVAKLWLEGKLTKGSGVSLSLLYKEIMSVRVTKLCNIIKSKHGSSDSETQKISDQAILVLCEVAFNMIVNNQFVSIDAKSQGKLEDTKLTLFVSLIDWFPGFVQIESFDAKGNPEYRFIHSTLQLFLSSQYICVCMEKCPEPEKTLEILCEKVKVSENRVQGNTLYMILLQVVNSIFLQQTPNKPVVKVLVELLSNCKDFNPFDVVKNAAYSPAIAREVSEVGRPSKSPWTIHDNNVLAAISLLKFTSPRCISLDIGGDPKEVQELGTLITLISKKELEFHLNFRYHLLNIISDFSDCYLSPILNPDSKCKFLTFNGKLSVDGCQYLLDMKSIKYLFLLVRFENTFDKILQNLQHLELEELFLYFTMPVVRLPTFFHALKVKEFGVQFDDLDESQIEVTASALSKMHYHYEKIIVNDMSASNAVKFVQMFQRNSKVKSFIRSFDCRFQGIPQTVFLDYGPIPLTQSIIVFYDQWQHTCVTVTEDEIGVKGLNIQAKGIRPSNINVAQWLPGSRILSTKLSGETIML